MTEDEIETEIAARVQEELDRRYRPLSWTLFLVTSGLCLIHAAILFVTVPRYMEMFKEMDIGELPLVTRAVCSDFALLLVPVIGVAALYFHRSRRHSGLIVLSGVLLLMFGFEVLGLFMPLFTIMDQLSGAGRR